MPVFAVVVINTGFRLCPERRSLRAYVSIIYSDPRMKVYLQGRKVQTKRLVSYLYKPRMYHYASKTFKTRAEAEVSRAKEEVKIGRWIAVSLAAMVVYWRFSCSGDEGPGGGEQGSRHGGPVRQYD